MKHQQRGFTLLELLITLLLSSLLIAAVSEVFLQSRKSFTKQQALSEIVEDGRYAVEMMAQEIRRAGFLVNPRRTDAGFAPADMFAADANPANSGIAFLAPIPPSTAPEFIRGDVSAGGFGNSHDLNHLVFRYQLDPSGNCSDPIYHSKAECNENGDTWTADPIDTDPGNTPCSAQVGDQNGSTYPNGKPRAAYIKNIYFFVNDTGDGPSLSCRAESKLRDGTIIDNNGGLSLPLVSNVEAMYILYGEDPDADNSANRYVSADAVVNWPAVVSVRIYLVLMSEATNVATADTSTYQIEGQSINVLNPNERRLYRVFTTTVALRK